MAKLLWSDRALASLQGQDDYLRARNPTAADTVLTEIETVAALIADFPEMGHRIEGTGLRCHVTRRYRYRVIYQVSEDRIRIVDVLHPRQK